MKYNIVLKQFKFNVLTLRSSEIYIKIQKRLLSLTASKTFNAGMHSDVY